MLAVAEGGKLVEDPHERVRAAALLEATERLRAVQDDLRRVLAEVAPDQVRILMPEQTYKGSYGQIAPRAALETVVRLSCAEGGVPVETALRLLRPPDAQAGCLLQARGAGQSTRGCFTGRKMISPSVSAPAAWTKMPSFGRSGAVCDGAALHGSDASRRGDHISTSAA
jgi:hypothetical protein